MKFTSAAVAAIMAGVASAHTTITKIYVNDVDQGLGNSAAGYIRSPPNNNPVKDITSSDMTCNVNNVATAKTVSVAAGDKITFEWHHNSNDASDDIIDASHKGPVITYIAPTSSNGAGDVWIKLAEEGFDGSEWAVTKLIANKGKHSITLPTSLATGTYLLRPEIIALHEADAAFNVNSARGAQFYMECVQIEVTSGGSTELPTGVAIPGAYSYADPGIVFNLYGSFTSYTIPGPAVYDGTSSGSDSSVVATSSATQVVSTSSVAQAVASSVAVTSAVATSTSISAQVTTSAVASVVQSTTVLSAVPTTLSTRVKCSKVSTASAASTTSTSSSGTVSKWAQCGGTGYTGVTACVSGTTCQVQNPYYSQCL